MAKRKILTDNDPTLRTVCRPVPRITPRIVTRRTAKCRGRNCRD